MQVMGKQGKNLNPATLTPRWFTRNPETARGAVRQVRAGRVKGVCFPPQAPPGLCIRFAVSGQTMGPGGLGGYLAAVAALHLGRLRPAATPEKAPRGLGQQT